MEADPNLDSEESVMENDDLNIDKEENPVEDNNVIETDMSQTSPDTPSNPPAGQAVLAQTPNLSLTVNSPYDLISSYGYLRYGGLDLDLSRLSQSCKRLTGYKNLDNNQPFHNGLYVTAAAPGVGKTSAMVQMAYQLAANGTHSIFFSLEQTAMDLFIKMITRKSYEKYAKSNGTVHAYTNKEVRNGSIDPSDYNALKNECLQDIQDRIHVMQGDFDGTVEDICQEVENMIDQLNGADICIFIDYLQVIPPSTINGRTLDTKSNMDHVVKKLKSLQKKCNIPIVLISSLNRQSYTKPLTIDCCKESGNIEYTADVIWGIQYTLLYKKEFYNHYDGKRKGKETNDREKQEMLMDAKSSNIRELTVSYLKNRFGEDGLKVHFAYFPKCDTFIPVDENMNIIS